MTVKIFFCYAHEDEPLLKKLKSHLRPLQLQELIAVWHDRDISAGTEWEQEISKHLNEAHIILLLISPDFMNSDYCYGIEMQRAIERHNSGEASVIPIILRPVDWEGAPFSKFQALPKNAKPVISWRKRDEAFLEIATGIRKVVGDIAMQSLNSPSVTPIQTAKPKSQQRQGGGGVPAHLDFYAKGVDEEALSKLRDEMYRKSEADRLLLEADKFAPNLFEKERLIKRAVELCPDYKQRRYRELGIEMSGAVINGYDPIQQMGRGMVGYRTLERNEIEWLTTSAISYLQENILDATTPDAEGLLYLACMYGYQQQFEEMMKSIAKAVKSDEEMKEGFQQRKILLTLLSACGSDQMKWAKLRKRLGIPLVSKNAFCKFIQDFDLTDFHGFIQWIAIKRPNTTGARGTFIIKIAPPYVQNKGLVQASALNVESWQYESVANGYLMSISKLYDALHASFVLLCHCE